MSFIPALQYGIGLGVFGFIFWILDNIREDIIAANVHQGGNIFDFLMLIFAGTLVVYVIFGGWWVIRKYNEAEYRGGYL